MLRTIAISVFISASSSQGLRQGFSLEVPLFSHTGERLMAPLHLVTRCLIADGQQTDDHERTGWTERENPPIGKADRLAATIFVGWHR